MATPLVLVFQELASPTATPEIPDLPTVVVGPAYDLLDYPDDAANILLSSTYGQLEQPAYTPPTSGTDAVTVNDNGYPSQSPGSRVDHDSVRPFLRLPRALLGSTYLVGVGPVFGSTFTTSNSDRTLITITGVATTDFVAAGIQPGDRLIITSSAGTQTVVRTVQSVGEPNSDGLVASGNENKLRLTQELPAPGVGTDDWTYDANGEGRIERTLVTQELLDPSNTFVVFPEPGTDKCVIKGGVQLDVALTPAATVAVPNPATTTVSRPLSYAEIYLMYRALRQDLQVVGEFESGALTQVNGVPSVVGVGKIDARNPLAVGLNIAIQNAGALTVYGYGVVSNDAVGHASAREAMENRDDLYAFVPLTDDIEIHAAYKSEWDQLADPNYASTNGVRQKFRIVIGAIPLPETTSVYEGSISGVAQQPSGAATGNFRTLSMASTGTINIRTVLPGDSVTIGLTPSAADWQNRRGTHKVGHVNASEDYPAAGPALLEIVPGSSRWDSSAGVSSSGDIELVIKAPDGSVKFSNLATQVVETGAGPTLGGIEYTMLNPTTVGGPYTITYVADAGVASPTIGVVGFAITVTVDGTTHTHNDVLAALQANATIAALMSVAVDSGGTQVVLPASQSPVAPAQIMPVASSCDTDILVNDDMFNRLNDTSATFLTVGVLPGDTIEFPLDPNNYTSTAYEGRLLSYRVASVLNENSLLIANGLDDSDTAANELPHYFARDYQDRFIDNTAPNAQNYRIVRALTKDEMITQLIATVQSARSKRLTVVWPDLMTVSDLRDGSLPRVVESTRTAATKQPGYYLACAVGGVVSAIPPQAGLTNGSFIGLSDLDHAQGYFSERQLSRLSNGGVFVCLQRAPGALPECLHQLTTDPTALETGELSVVKNVDFLSKTFKGVLETFLGQYNVLPETLNEINRAVSDTGLELKSRKVARVGAPLLEGSISSLAVSEFSADRVELFYTGRVPRPLNTIAFHLVV